RSRARGPLTVENMISRGADRFREGVAVPIPCEAHTHGVIPSDDQQAVVNLKELAFPGAWPGHSLSKRSSAGIAHGRAEVLYFEIGRVVARRLIAGAFQPQLGGDVALVCALRCFAFVEAAVARPKVIDDRRAERVRPVRHRLLPAHVLVIAEGRPDRRTEGGNVGNDIAAVDSVPASKRVVGAAHELIVSGAL